MHGAVRKTLSTFIWITAIAAAQADPGDQLTTLMDSMPDVINNAYVEIRSDAALTNAGALAAQFVDAYNFDRRLLGLTSNQLLNKRFVVGLATENTLQRFMKSTTGGRAFGNDSFISHANFYSERPDFAWFVTAHELEHLQMHRLRAKEPDVPVYIFEGIACSVGDRYVFSKFGKCKYLQNAVGKLSSVSASDAADVIQNFRDSDSVANFKAQNKLWQGEHIGGLFIEYLQSKYPSGKFFLLFGQICEDVSAGNTFEAAFQRRMGTSLASAESEFLSHITSTENSPRSRFANTIYAGFSDK